MKVRSLPNDPGPAGWNCLLPAPSPAQVLTGSETADWLVVGGGFAGLAAVRRLSQLHPSDRIVLLEARRIAEGPAGRNSGFMIDLPHDLASADYGGAIAEDKAQTHANRAAIRFAEQMAQDFDLPAEAFVQSGKINAAATEKGHDHNRDYAAHLAQMDEPCRLLGAGDMARITGTQYYQSGLFTPGTAMIQPAMFVRGIAGALASERVRILENSPVIALDRDGDWVATTPKGRVTAPRVILAVNGHANSFGYFPKRLMHVFTYASMTRALSQDEDRVLGGEATWNMTPADPMGTTVRRVAGLGGSRIIIRNRFTYDPAMVVSDRRIAHVAKDHRRAFAARFPMLKEVEFDYSWGGRLCLSWNNVAAFGEVAPQLYAACCQNGLGTAKGTLNGMLAAEMASGIASELLSAQLATAAPKRVPPSPFDWIGATARLKYSEYIAGREM